MMGESETKDPTEGESRKGLPPRPQPMHKRSWSGGVNFAGGGVGTVLQSFTPPIMKRKKASTAQEEREEFHKKNQKFLQSVQKSTVRDSPSMQRWGNGSANGSFSRNSPRGRGLGLQAIDDDWEDNNDSVDDDNSGSDAPPPAPERIEFKGMHLLDEDELQRFSETSFDEIKDGSMSSADFSFNERQLRSQIIENQLLKEQEERQQNRKLEMEERLSSVLERDIPASQRDKQDFLQVYMQELEKEREALIQQWRAEFEAESAAMRDLSSNDRPSKYIDSIRAPFFNFLATLEIFICNMPLTIAAAALSWATLGVVWYKFTAENLTIAGLCKPVPFHSSLNTYRHEFPGSFDCEGGFLFYTALYFHFGCSIFAAFLSFLFLAKVFYAWRVVSDDLTNPVTATPVGVMCITLEVLGAAAGKPGEILVFATAIFHGFFAIWYLYVAVIKFKLLPDPSWFPGTVGLAYAAVKTWTYCNIAGKIFLCLCLAFFFGTFFISFIRIALNKKIAAPVCWIQLSAPSIALYAASIMSQPTQEQEEAIESSPIANHLYHEQMHDYYLPFQHFMFALSLLGMASALQSLWARWDTLRQREFSPAHLAFCFPTLSHTNAVQAYRAAVNSFSTIPKSSPFHGALYGYWVICLGVGSIVNLIFTYKAIVCLPKWTNITIAGETEPPEQSDTIMAEMLHDTQEVIAQPFVSPAVLQANEAGTLIRVRRGTEDYRLHGPYVRTRQVASYGFDLTMSDEELREERARLLDWVARNAPRTRNRTLSIPMMLKLKNDKGQGIYGTFDAENPADNRHRRSQTMGDMF